MRLRWTIIRSEFPGVTDFERDFPSLCFALATGVGKTRLMGAFITYLHLAHGINNFFVLAPNLTIYNKLIADFTPNTPKYVFKGIAEFATTPPVIITGDNYEQARSLSAASCFADHDQIFNISKINVRSARRQVPAHQTALPEVHRRELLRLSGGPARPRAAHGRVAPLPGHAGMRAINELKPVLGLELTATPFVETRAGPGRRSRT